MESFSRLLIQKLVQKNINKYVLKLMKKKSLSEGKEISTSVLLKITMSHQIIKCVPNIDCIFPHKYCILYTMSL